MLEYWDLLSPVKTNPIVYVPLMRGLADRINCPVSGEVVKKVEDDGLTIIAELGTPSRYSTGTTRTYFEGAADRSYLNTYDDVLDPVYLFKSP